MTANSYLESQRLKSKDLIERPSLGRSSMWVFGGTVLSKPIQLFTSVLLARLLGPANFGLFGLTTSMAVTLSLIAGFGLGDASYKYVAEFYRADKGRGACFGAVIFWSSSLFSALIFLVLWLLRSLWVSRVFPSAIPATVVGLCLCLSWTNLVFSVVSGVLSGLQYFRHYTIMAILQAAGVAGFAIMLGFKGVGGALIAYVIGSGVCLGWGGLVLLRTDPGLLRWPGLTAFRELRRILHFSAPFWIGSLVLTPVVTLALGMLASQPGGQYQLGIFNTANSLRMLIALLPGVIATVITPALIQEGGSMGNPRAFGKLLEKSFSALTLATIPLLIVCLFLSDLLLSIYGKAYGGSFRLFMPLVAASAIGAIGSPVIPVMSAKNKTWSSLGFGLLKSAVLVTLCLWWLPSYLATGLAWAMAISETGFCIMAIEFCIYTGAVSNTIRTAFYSLTITVAFLLVLAVSLPDVVRWALALPLAVFALIHLLRKYHELANWLPTLAPPALQPRAQTLMSFITS